MIYMVGFHASGKSYASKMFADRFNVLHFETSTIVKNAHRESGTSLSIAEWAKVMERAYGETVFDDLISDVITIGVTDELLAGRRYDDVVISGNRSYTGIENITGNLLRAQIPVRQEREIVLVSTSVETLYQRFCNRDREQGDATMSLADFTELMETERERGIDGIFDHITHTIDNSYDTLHLEKQLVRFGRSRDLFHPTPEKERMRNV